MRTLAFIAAVVVAVLLLFSSGTVSGEVCLHNLGCLRGDDAGFRLDRSAGPRPRPADRP